MCLAQPSTLIRAWDWHGSLEVNILTVELFSYDDCVLDIYFQLPAWKLILSQQSFTDIIVAD